MPTIDISKKDLEGLVGKKIPMPELEEALLFAKGEVDSVEGDNIKVDIKETNRPDLWSVEGIARELRARLGIEKGIRNYRVAKARVSCTIEKSVEGSRPFIACAIVRSVKVTDEFIRQIVQLQEKVGMTFGRKRKEAGIGLYDFDRMTPPVFYRGYKDEEIEYVPLDWKVPMRPSEILQQHQKGKEFAHLLKGMDRYPIVIDSKNVVASMPPIINSESTGKITFGTKNIFIESTGYNWETVNIALKVICVALADRGGKIEAVKIIFPKGGPYPKAPVETPFFRTKKITLDMGYAREISGLELQGKEIVALLGKARYAVKKKADKLELEYPDYRNDILHPVDIVEDILIGYGYNMIGTLRPEMVVTGAEQLETPYIDKVRDACVGLGLQEVLTFVLTSKGKQANMVGRDPEKEEFVEITNPVSSNWGIMRKSIYPELLEFLSKNKHVEYPQRIFEVGKTVELDANTDTRTRERTKLCIALAGKGCGFTLIKSALVAVCRDLGKKCSLHETSHPALKEGRRAEITGDTSGILGEVSEEVKKNFGLEQDVVLLEMEL